MRNFLLSLYPRVWRQRYGEEIADLLAQEPLSVRLVIDLIRGALDARLHPQLAGPILAAAGGGTVQVPSRGPRIGLFVLVVVFLLLLVFGGLYAYRSQTPAVPQVPVTQVLSEIQAGHVQSIVVEDYIATVTLDDGTKQVSALGGQSQKDMLDQAVALHDKTSGQQGGIRYEIRSGGADSFAPILLPLSSLLLTLLPIALLALLVLLLARRLMLGSGAAQRASRYEWLARIADLRDRGILTEEEFQREKGRLLE